jgi:hypothetical protein
MHDIWKPSFQLEQSVLVAILKAKEKAPAEQTRRDQRTDLQALSYKQGTSFEKQMDNATTLQKDVLRKVWFPWPSLPARCRPC